MANISSKLFNQQVMTSLKSLDDRISILQEQTSTGKKKLLSSDDPVAVGKLNAGKELLTTFNRYLDNAQNASDRLGLADTALMSVEPLLIRLSELNIQANNDTLNHQDRLAIMTEVEELKSFLLDIANSRDVNGVAIFGGTAGDIDPFQKVSEGNVNYFGDLGQMKLAISENKNIETAISGFDTFMSISSPLGNKSIFQIIDEFSSALMFNQDGVSELDVTNKPTILSFALNERPATIQFDLNYDGKSYPISANLVNGHLSGIVTEVENLNLPISITSTGNALSIGNNTDKGLILSDLTLIDSNEKSDTELKVNFDGKEWLQTNKSLQHSLKNINSAIEHVSLQQAKLGAKIKAADTQIDIINNLRTTVIEDVSELEDADLAEVVTELKQLLLNKDAAQQVYAKLNQQTLFDFIR